MVKNVKIPDAELEIMMIIWDSNGSVTSEDIMKKLDGKKTWKRTTVLKFLSRLTERGFLSLEKKSKTNVYCPLIKQDEYLEYECKNFLERICQNSVKKLVATLYSSKSISEDDLAELRQFIDKER